MKEAKSDLDPKTKSCDEFTYKRIAAFSLHFFALISFSIKQLTFVIYDKNSAHGRL